MAKRKNYPCPNPKCKKPINTFVPSKKDVTEKKPYWDSAVVCPHCSELHSKKVYPGGIIHVKLMPTAKVQVNTPLSDRAGVNGMNQKAGITKYLPENTKVKAPKAGKIISAPFTTVYTPAASSGFKLLGFKKHIPFPEQDKKFYVLCKNVKHPLIGGLRIIIEETRTRGIDDVPWITVECYDTSEGETRVPIISCKLTARNLVLVMQEFGNRSQNSVLLITEKLGIE